jgi:hypothetical protein
MRYLELDLLIEPAEKGYCARIIQSPAGQASAEFELPFSRIELDNFVLRLGRSRGSTRRVESSEMAAAKKFGGDLFKAVFTGDLRSCLRSSNDEADRQGMGLRVRLRLAGVPDLGDLPWEYLYDPGLNRFLALSTDTPIVRYLDLPEAVRPVRVKPPLRILAVVASPSDFPPLEVDREFENLSRALGELTAQGVVALDRLAEPTLADLQRRLRQTEYHVFHFIGHGGFDRQVQDGVLYFQSPEGRGRPVGAQYLGALLHDHRSLRLAVLNACEGARGAEGDPFSGTAQGLVQQGIPAVIAMQFEVSDEAAITFSQEFYSAVAVGYPMDAALAEARKAIFAQVSELEWGTPVLYMRSVDGRIFDLQEVGEEQRRQVQEAARRRQTREVKVPPELRQTPPPAPPPTPATTSPPPSLPPLPVVTAPPVKPEPARPPAAAPATPAVRHPFRILAIGFSVVLVLLFLVGSCMIGIASFANNPKNVAPFPPLPAPPTAPDLDLKASLHAALNNAQDVRIEAMKTLDKSRLGTAFIGIALAAENQRIDNLRGQGFYAEMAPFIQEIQPFTPSSDGLQAQVNVWETSEGIRYVSHQTGECWQTPPLEGDSTYFLVRNGSGWLVSEIQSHYPIPHATPCNG